MGLYDSLMSGYTSTPTQATASPQPAVDKTQRQAQADMLASVLFGLQPGTTPDAYVKSPWMVNTPAQGENPATSNPFMGTRDWYQRNMNAFVNGGEQDWGDLAGPVQVLTRLFGYLGKPGGPGQTPSSASTSPSATGNSGTMGINFPNAGGAPKPGTPGVVIDPVMPDWLKPLMGGSQAPGGNGQAPNLAGLNLQWGSPSGPLYR